MISRSDNYLVKALNQLVTLTRVCRARESKAVPAKVLTSSEPGEESRKKKRRNKRKAIALAIAIVALAILRKIT